MIRLQLTTSSTLFPYTTLFRSDLVVVPPAQRGAVPGEVLRPGDDPLGGAEVLALEAADLRDGDGAAQVGVLAGALEDRKSTRLNSSHSSISYAVFCLKKKNRSQ